jgi:hypothetical protein
MSLVNLAAQPDRAFLITDSGYFNPDGTIRELATKVLLFREQRVAVSWTSKGFILPQLAAYLVQDVEPNRLRAMKQDDLIYLFPIWVQRAYERFGRNPDQDWSRFSLALWSQKMGGRGLTFSTSSASKAGAWVYQPAAVMLMPLIPEWSRDDLLRLTDPLQFREPEQMMPIIERQCAPDIWKGNGPGGDHIGVAGRIVLTCLSASGVTSEVLRESSDRIGTLASGLGVVGNEISVPATQDPPVLDAVEMLEEAAALFEHCGGAQHE